MNSSELEEFVPIGTTVHRQVNLATARCRINFLDGFCDYDLIVREALVDQGICPEQFQAKGLPDRKARVNDLIASIIVNKKTRMFLEVHLLIFNGSEWRCIAVGKATGTPCCCGLWMHPRPQRVDPAFKVREAIEKNWTWPTEEAGLLTSASAVPTVVAAVESDGK